MEVDHLAHVHLVDVVGAEDRDEVRGLVIDEVEVLVHGDLWAENIILDKTLTRVRGIIDFELSAFGDNAKELYGTNTFFEADYVFMRVAEMYLIEAEANANEGLDVPAAAALYKLVSDRDPSYTLSSNTGSALMDEIRLHRRL